MTTATQTINHNAMGIQELNDEMVAGRLSTDQAFAIVQKRIDKRTAEKRNQLLPVVKFRNALAAALRSSSVVNVSGMSTEDMPIPAYAAKAPAPSAMSADPKQLADQVFALVGAENISAVISHLASRVVGIPATK